MKKLSLILVFALILGLLAGCAGTPVVYYTNCTCPVDAHEDVVVDIPATIPSYEEAPVLTEGALKTGLAIKEELKQYLPSYMIPRKIVLRESFPINTNGKVDRKQLALELK